MEIAEALKPAPKDSDSDDSVFEAAAYFLDIPRTRYELSDLSMEVDDRRSAEREVNVNNNARYKTTPQLKCRPVRKSPRSSGANSVKGSPKKTRFKVLLKAPDIGSGSDTPDVDSAIEDVPDDTPEDRLLRKIEKRKKSLTGMYEKRAARYRLENQGWTTNTVTESDMQLMKDAG